MKLSHFEPTKTARVDVPAPQKLNRPAAVVTEDVDQIPEAGDVIRTKQSDMEGKVERVNGQDVFFRLSDGRLMRTAVTNTIVIEQLADEEDDVFEEELDEVSNEVLTKYKTAAGKSASDADKRGDYATGDKRFSGIVKATKKQFSNDAKKKEINEEEVAGEYVKNYQGWANDAASYGFTVRDDRSKGGTILALDDKGQKVGVFDGSGVGFGVLYNTPGELQKKLQEIQRAGGTQKYSNQKYSQEVRDYPAKLAKTMVGLEEDEVFNDVRNKWKNEQLSELSTGKMQDYKDAAKSEHSFRTRPLRKLAKSVQGSARADGKILAKQTDAVKKYTTEANFSSILKKQEKEKAAAPTQKSVVDVDYHGWTIRYRPAFKPNDSVAWMILDKRGDPKHKGLSGTDADAVRDAEEWIKAGGGGTKVQASASVTIDFNVNFAKEIAPGGESFYAGISANSNLPTLTVSYEPGQGLKNSHLRTPEGGGGATRLPTISLTSKESNAAGLQPNGRYVLGDRTQVDDNTYTFPLIFQGVSQSPSDKMRLGKPGLIVAHVR